MSICVTCWQTIRTSDFNFLTLSCSNNGKNFSGSIYQRCSDRLETAVTLGWSAGGDSKSPTSLSVGAKYDLDKEATVRAHVGIDQLIGLGYQQKLRDGKKDLFLKEA